MYDQQTWSKCSKTAPTVTSTRDGLTYPSTNADTFNYLVSGFEPCCGRESGGERDELASGRARLEKRKEEKPADVPWKRAGVIVSVLITSRVSAYRALSATIRWEPGPTPPFRYSSRPPIFALVFFLSLSVHLSADSPSTRWIFGAPSRSPRFRHPAGGDYRIRGSVARSPRRPEWFRRIFNHSFPCTIRD